MRQTEQRMPSTPPGLFAIWPGLAIIVLALAVAASPALRWADQPAAGGGRAAPIDGLRGFAALGVFLHHAVITHAWLVAGIWRLPPSRFYTMAGQAGVALFFMITGMLFWSRLIARDGRMGWAGFGIGRICRIGPLYLAAAAAAIAIAAARTGFALHQPAWQVFKELVKWSALGAFGNGPDVNGDRNTSLILAGVVWTLQCEWAFYASLLPLAVFTRDRRAAAMLPAAVLSLVLLHLASGAPTPATPYAIDIALFSAGMLIASAAPLVARLAPRWLRSAGALALLVAAFAFCDTAYAPAPILLLAGAFLLIASGADLFGLLSSRAAGRLGAISYGVYLLQGLVLTTLFAAPGLRRFALGAPLQYWAVLALAAILLLLVATIAHVAIEQPGIGAGRRFAAWLAGLRAARRERPPSRASGTAIPPVS